MKSKNKKILVIILILILIMPFCTQTTVLGLDTIYKEPSRDGDKSQVQKRGLDDMINDAEKFERGEGAVVGGTESQTFELNTDNLQTFSNNLYTVLLIAATAITVVIGIVIGVKHITGSVEEKAEYKKIVYPYLIGCVVVYGSFGIWKLVVEVLKII